MMPKISPTMDFKFKPANFLCCSPQISTTGNPYTRGSSTIHPHVFTSSDQLLLILKIDFTLLTKQTNLARRSIVQSLSLCVRYGIKISAGKCCQKYQRWWTSNSNLLIFLCTQAYKPHISTAGNLYSLHCQVQIASFNIENIFYFVNKTI